MELLPVVGGGGGRQNGPKKKGETVFSSGVVCDLAALNMRKWRETKLCFSRDFKRFFSPLYFCEEFLVWGRMGVLGREYKVGMQRVFRGTYFLRLQKNIKREDTS